MPHVGASRPIERDPIYTIVNHVSANWTTDVLLFSLVHRRWEFVFPLKYAAYFNLIESWWKVLRALALKGRRSETWNEVCQAVEQATAYWHKHHLFIWGWSRRYQPRRKPGIAALPKVA